MKQKAYNKILAAIFFIISVGLIYLGYLFVSLYVSHADFNNIGEIVLHTFMIFLLIVWIEIPVCMSGYLAYSYFNNK